MHCVILMIPGVILISEMLTVTLTTLCFILDNCSVGRQRTRACHGYRDNRTDHGVILISKRNPDHTTSVHLLESGDDKNNNDDNNMML